MYHDIIDEWAEEHNLGQKALVIKNKKVKYVLYRKDIQELKEVIRQLMREHLKKRNNILNDLGFFNTFETLRPRQKEIMKMRFVKLMEREEVAKVYGVSKQNIIRIEYRALAKMQSGLKTVREFKFGKSKYKRLIGCQGK